MQQNVYTSHKSRSIWIILILGCRYEMLYMIYTVQIQPRERRPTSEVGHADYSGPTRQHERLVLDHRYLRSTNLYGVNDLNHEVGIDGIRYVRGVKTSKTERIKVTWYKTTAVTLQ